MEINNIYLDESNLNIIGFEQQAPDLGSVTKYYFCKIYGCNNLAVSVQTQA
jgi:hypothetical protein